MVCRQLALLPQPSVAVHVRKITPWPVQLVLPKLLTKLMFATPLHVSVAVATPVLLVVGGMVHSRTRSAGQVTMGALVSLTITSVLHAVGQLLLVMLRARVKLCPHTLPEVTDTFRALVGPEMEPLPVSDQE